MNPNSLTISDLAMVLSSIRHSEIYRITLQVHLRNLSRAFQLVTPDIQAGVLMAVEENIRMNLVENITEEEKMGLVAIIDAMQDRSLWPSGIHEEYLVTEWGLPDQYVGDMRQCISCYGEYENHLESVILLDCGNHTCCGTCNLERDGHCSFCPQ
jgi:hypothetical protein